MLKIEDVKQDMAHTFGFTRRTVVMALMKRYNCGHGKYLDRQASALIRRARLAGVIARWRSRGHYYYFVRQDNQLP